MSPRLTPCSLHWSGDGELAASDRQDLLQFLALADNRWAQWMLTWSMPWPDHPSPAARPQPSDVHI